MIVVYGIKESLGPVKAELSRIIHHCMQTALGLPEDKKAQRFIPMEKADFYIPGGRSDAYTVIEINIMQGRKEETVKTLIKALFTTIESELGIAPADIEITVKEQPPYCWGFRGMTGDEARLNYDIKV